MPDGGAIKKDLIFFLKEKLGFNNMTGLLYLNGDLGGDVMSDGRETVGLFPTAMQISMLPEAAVLNKDLMREVQKIRNSTSNGRPDSSVHTTLFTDDKLH